MRAVALVMQEEVGQSLMSRTVSSGLSPFVQPVFEQLSYETMFSVWMHSTQSEQLFRNLRDGNENNSLSFSAEVPVESH